jgi:hypothetical protein
MNEVLAAVIGNVINFVISTAKHDRQRNVNNYGCYIVDNPMAALWFIPMIDILAAILAIQFMMLLVVVANITILILCIKGA